MISDILDRAADRSPLHFWVVFFLGLVAIAFVVLFPLWLATGWFWLAGVFGGFVGAAVGNLPVYTWLWWSARKGAK